MQSRIARIEFMGLDTLPFPTIFPVCVDILRENLIPTHYVELTKAALLKLGLTPNDVNWQRQIEDVREKLLQAGRYETFYIGDPYCLGGLRWWFETGQLRLLHPTQGITIPGNAQSGVNGAFEALMRFPEYKIKNPNAPLENRTYTCARGLVLQEHISDWFKQKWPKFWLPPENHKQWKTGCSHDFRLNIDGDIIKIDVSGPRLNGTFGNPGNGKHLTDFHLICEIIGQDVLWRDIRRGTEYQSILFPEAGICPERLVVWLNCLKHNIDYKAIKSNVNSHSEKHNANPIAA